MLTMLFFEESQVQKKKLLKLKPYNKTDNFYGSTCILTFKNTYV